MQFPPHLLDLLIDHDAFRVCRIMPEDEFLRYCNDRNIKVDRNRLRQFERIGVFHPLMRAFKPKVTLKVETVGHQYRELGQLEDGEVWLGETRDEILNFEPRTTVARDWRDHSLLWVPGQGAWEHQDTIDSQPDRHETYYSRFQIFALQHVTSLLTLSVQLEWAVNPDGSVNEDWNSRLEGDTALFASLVAKMKTPQRADILAVFLQLIANRFYYATQTDRRRVTVGQHHDWDWDKYACSWRSDQIVDAVQVAEDDTSKFYEQLDLTWSHDDPIGAWRQLVQYISVDKRNCLKGDALRAASLRDMAQMVRMFHKAAFGKALRPIGEVGVQILKRIPDIDSDVDPTRALELVSNAFGINGKPQLVLFVEGVTEESIIPDIFQRLYGASISYYGIEVRNLGGVDNAAGSKKARNSALWLLVDYLHHHQTLAFVLLDNEGLANRNVVQGLSRAMSVHSPVRKATRPDHIKVWDTSFELENFSDTEIARALNMLAGVRLFARSDITECRLAVESGPKKGQKLLTIDRLYEARVGAQLSKPCLGRALVELMFEPSSRRKPLNRPIARFLVRIAEKAARNHQPTTHERWEANQRSGYLGSLRPVAQQIRRRMRAQARAEKKTPGKR